ncbi:MAG: hypothetical protein JRJ41_00930 [Deltaproteobacteria bacterium]|jgi:hypothetical protein|nr:hypothetical protein [Deltaproteobacteria bacterium]
MPEHRLSYPIKRWDLRDVVVLLLIIISTFLAGWILTLEKTKYIVVVVEENVSKEVKYYKATSKEKLEEWMIEKLKI